MDSWASRDFEEKQLLQMRTCVNGDVVYESTKSPHNFGGPKAHASVKSRTITERNEFSS